MSCPQKTVTKCVLPSWSPSPISWSCVILYGRRSELVVPLCAVVLETCTYWANCAKDFEANVLIWLQYC
jgi:hypothetical protein